MSLGALLAWLIFFYECLAVGAIAILGGHL